MQNNGKNWAKSGRQIEPVKEAYVYRDSNMATRLKQPTCHVLASPPNQFTVVARAYLAQGSPYAVQPLL